MSARPIAFPFLLFVTIVPAILFACTREPAKQPERPEIDETVQPVYPASIAPDPLAEKLCGVLHDLPAERKAACCGVPRGLVLTSECTRMLSGALSFKAVALSKERVDLCAADLAAVHDGCEWVGGPPQVPTSCRDLIAGVIPKGKKCRSTLECEDGLRCQGVGPTDPGVCLAPFSAGGPCETATDALVTYAMQTHVFHAVPECQGRCDLHRCQAPVPLGGGCERAADCGPGNRCGAGTCVTGSFGKAGEACGGADCEAGLRCIAQKCGPPKGKGEKCAADVECRGGCVKGVCDKRC